MSDRRFIWDDWNRDHVAKHDVGEDEAEHVASGAKAPYPRKTADDKFVVWGPTPDGRLLQVIFVLKRDDDIDYESMSMEAILELERGEAPYGYIIHARDLTDREKFLYRKAQ